MAFKFDDYELIDDYQPSIFPDIGTQLPPEEEAISPPEQERVPALASIFPEEEIPSIFPEIAPPEEDYLYSGEGFTGVIGDMARASLGGINKGIEMVGGSIDWFYPDVDEETKPFSAVKQVARLAFPHLAPAITAVGLAQTILGMDKNRVVEKYGKDVANWARRNEELFPELYAESEAGVEARKESPWNMRGWLHPGFKSAGMMLPGIATGPAAPYTMGVYFWGGTAQETYDKTKESNPEWSEARRVTHANLKGGVEGGLEMAQMIPILRLGKVIPKSLKGNIIKAIAGKSGKPMWNFAKEAAKFYGAEVGMEMLQEYLGGMTDYGYGVREDMPTLEELSHVIGPTLVAMTVLGSGSAFGNIQERRKLGMILEHPESTQSDRVAAAQRVYQGIKHEDPELASIWFESTKENLRDNKPVIMLNDADYYAQLKEVEPDKEIVEDSPFVTLEEIVAEPTEEISSAVPFVPEEKIYPPITPEGIEFEDPSISDLDARIFEEETLFEKYQPEVPPEILKDQKSAEESARVFEREGLTEIEIEAEVNDQVDNYFTKEVIAAQEIGEEIALERVAERDVKQEALEAAFEAGVISEEEFAAKQAEAAVKVEEKKEAEFAKVEAEEAELVAEREQVLPEAERTKLRKEAEQEAGEDPIYKIVDDGRADPINLGQLKVQYPTIAAEIGKKFPFMVSGNGRVSPDAFAEKHGYESVDKLVEALKAVPSKRAATDKLYSQKVTEWLEAEDLMRKEVPIEEVKGIPERIETLLNLNDQAIAETPAILAEKREENIKRRRKESKADFTGQADFDTWYNKTPLASRVGIVYEGRDFSGNELFTITKGLLAGTTRALPVTEGVIDTELFSSTVNELIDDFSDEVELAAQLNEIMPKFERMAYSDEFLTKLDEEIQRGTSIEQAKKEIRPPAERPGVRDIREDEFRDERAARVERPGAEIRGEEAPGVAPEIPTEVRPFDEVAAEVEKESEAVAISPFTTKTKITSEDGRAYILEDLVTEIFKAGQTLNQFSKTLRQKLGNAYSQIIAKVKSLYEKLNAHLEKITLGAEVGAIKIKELPTTVTPKFAKDRPIPLKAPRKRLPTMHPDKLRELVQTLDDNAIDVITKQRALAKHIHQQLPISERGRRELITQITNLGVPKTAATRQKYFEKAIELVDQRHEEIVKKQTIEKIDKLVKKAEPKRVTGKPVGKMTAEAHSFIAKINDHLAMEPTHAADQLDKLIAEIGPEMENLTDEQLDEMILLSQFTDLESKSSTELESTLERLEDIVKRGKIFWKLKESQRKEDMTGLRDTANAEFTGGKDIEAQKDRNRLKQDKLWTQFSDGIRGFDDNHQSWEWLLDKFSRYSPGATLAGSTTKHFSSLEFDANEEYDTAIRELGDEITAKAQEIYGVKGRKLAGKLNDNIVVKPDTRVFVNDVEKPLSQNEAYKIWQWIVSPSLTESMASHGWDDVAREQLESYMTPEVRAWAEWQVDEFYPKLREERYNPTYRDRFYIDMANIHRYSPMVRDVSSVTEDDMLLADKPSFASEIPGAVKSRTANRHPPKIIDGDSVLMNHITQMEHFKAWTKPIQEIRSVLTSDSVLAGVEAFHGKEAKKVLMKFVNDFARGGVDRSQNLHGLDALRSNTVVAMIGMNPVVFTKQLTSFPAYMMDMPLGKFTSGALDLVSNPAKYKEKAGILLSSKHLKNRYQLGHERDIAAALQKNIPEGIADKLNFRDLYMLPTKVGDAGAIMMGGWSYYKWKHDEYIKTMPEAEAKEKALRDFAKVTNRNQQSSRLGEQGGFQRGNSYAKLLTMFMTSPQQYYRNVAGGYRNLWAGRGSKSDNLKRLAIAQFILPMTFQFVASGLKWDDEDQLRAVLIGPLNGVFLLRDGISALMQGLTSGRTYSDTGRSPAFTIFESAGRVGIEAYRLITDHDMASWADLFDEVVTTLSYPVGFPYKVGKKIYKGVEAGVTGKTEYPILRAMGFSEKSLKSGVTKKQKTRRAKPKRKRATARTRP